jgi:hypothetical protein
MTIGDLLTRWRWSTFAASLFCAALPLTAGMIPLAASNSSKTDYGWFKGGATVYLSTGGTIGLAENDLLINPDGSLASIASCTSCWADSYQYFRSGAAYPTFAGGDGLNHFSGGGANYDLFPTVGYNQLPDQGVASTDTTNPNVIRFGAVAGTWSANPTPHSSDWFFVGYGGSFVAPEGGANLYLIVVDTYYINNVGNFDVFVTDVPEPSASWLASSGMLFLAVCAVVVRRKQTLPRKIGRN